jgi:hypothetical protein
MDLDLDGLPGFSVLEKYSMSRIWSRVAGEDFVAARGSTWT